ncbi:MAG: leucine-rich repeat domain-containing protein [Bacteroidaceae bacterium]|nr:leucine-rich repeat domain-containing protein [Bacteroidaceae bacterium]
MKPYSNDTWDSKTKTLIVNWKPICGGSNNVETNYQNQWAIEYVVIAPRNEPGTTTIPHDVFKGCRNLKAVYFDNTVTSIEYQAFKNCESLKTVVCTSGVAPTVAVASDAFEGTHPDMKIYVPKGLFGEETVPNPYVESWISYFCAVTLEGNTLAIRGVGDMDNNQEYDIAWNNDKGNITSAIIEQGVRSIGSYTFSGCTKLASVTIPKDLKTIGPSSFAGCVNLTTLTLPASVTTINTGAFSGCTGLTTLYVQSSTAPTLGNGVFDGCSALTTVVVPAASDYNSWNLGEKLKPGYFITCDEGITVTTAHNCLMLQQGETATLSLIGSGTVQYVVTKDADGSDVTAAVLSGSTLTMPAYDITVRATTITGSCGKTANDQVTWSYAPSTHTLTISGTGEMADYDNTNQPWAGYKNLITSLVVEDGVTSIGSKILYQFPYVTSVNIASSVTKIGAAAFCDCLSLVDVIGASGVTDAIDSNIFNNTPWLNSRINNNELIYVGHVAYKYSGPSTSITLDANTTQIAKYAFSNCQIRVIVIPASVTRIGDYAFQSLFNSPLQKVWFLGTTPPVLGNNVFAGCSAISDIFVPAASLGSYSTSLPGFSEKLKGGYFVTCGTGVTATTTNNIPLVLKGEIVTLGVNVPDGYIFAGYSVKDAEGHDVNVTESNGDYTFTMPANNVTANATFTMSWTSLQTLLTNSSTDVANPTLITLERDIVAEGNDSYLNIPAGHHVIIDLNGHKIDRNMTESQQGGYVIKLDGQSNNHASLVIRDSQGGGQITGGFDGTSSGQSSAGGINVQNSDLTLEGGSICGNKCTFTGGGGVRLGSGTFTMTGGTITGNVVNTLKGSPFAGAAIYGYSGDIYLSGGSITGNTAYGSSGDQTSGGFTPYSGANPAKLHLSGTFTMSGNKKISYDTSTQDWTKAEDSDYLHYSNDRIHLDGPINPTAPIIIDLNSSYNTQLTKNWNTHMGTTDPATCFTPSDNDNIVVRIGNELRIGTPRAIYWGADANHDGSTEEKAYIITTPEGLIYLSSECNSGNSFLNTFFMLNNDIDMSSVDNFEPIGHNNVNNGPKFEGTFNGAGHTISHLTINKPDDYNVGFFACINKDGYVKNVTLDGAVITGCNVVGGITGNLSGRLENCHIIRSTITATVTNMSPDVGAFTANINSYNLSHIKDNTYHSTLVYTPNGYGYIFSYAFNIGAARAANDCRGDFNNSVCLDKTKLFLDDNCDNSALIAAYANPEQYTAYDHQTPPTFSEGIDVTLRGRTLYKDGAWNTLCLPFDVSTTSGPLSGDGVTAMTLNTSTSNLSGSTLTLNFTEVSPSGEQGGLIPAGTPFIIKWGTPESHPNSDLKNPVFPGVTIDYSASTEVSFTGGTFKGTYNPMTFTDENKSILFLGYDAEDTEHHSKLYYPESGARIYAFRSYFQLDSPAAVKEFKLSFGEEDSETSLSEISQSEELRMKNEECDGAIYDMSGRKINRHLSPNLSSFGGVGGGCQLPRGIYIKNGKKIYIK